MFSCWFCMKKRKSLENISNNSYDKNEVQNYNFSKKNERDPLTPKFNNLKNKEIKSYPASPVKVSHDRGYFSDHRDQQVSLERRRMKCYLGLETKDSLELIATNYKHDSTVAFPCQVPLSSPLVKDSASEKTESKFCVAEKPMEDYALPSTSKQIDPLVYDKQTLVMEDKPENWFNAHPKNTEKKTIIRFRPGSFVSAKPSGGLCKNMTLRPDVSCTQPPTYSKHVVDVPLRPIRGSVILKTADGKLLEPIGTDKVRSSIRGHRESEVRRPSAAGSLQESATPIMPVRRSSMSRSSEATGSVEPKLFPSQSPEVYAVPVTTRGRSGSVLQSSVRSLASKSDKPLINRKNIRYSMDTDVFSPETRRSVKRTVPNYVNMDKGRPLLVSDVLNPITSLFITDLKDTVPKDPLTKPKESNKWVKPRRNNEQRTTPHKSATLTPSAVHFQEQSLRSSGTNKRARPQSYKPRDSSSSYSSDEEEDRDFQCAKFARGKQHVYAVELPENILTDPKEGKNKNPPFKKKGKSKETDVRTNSNVNSCGLNCNVSEIHKSPIQEVATQNKNNVTPTEQPSEEDDDLQHYPSKEFMRAGSQRTESGSKLRWRIIIKRGDDK